VSARNAQMVCVHRSRVFDRHNAPIMSLSGRTEFKSRYPVERNGQRQQVEQIVVVVVAVVVVALLINDERL